jgi:hypothetical protein
MLLKQPQTICYHVIPHFKMAIEDSKLFRVLDKAFTSIVCAFLVLAIILIPMDAYEFINQPENYITVHHLDTSKNFWQFQYLKGSGLIFFGALTMSILIFFSFKYKENKKLVTIRQILVFSLIGIIISGYYKWILTGFDH